MNEQKITADEEVESLLPWYLNGTLEGEERRMVEELLGRSKGARQELEFLKALAGEVESESLPPPSELGWRRLRRHIESEAKQPARNWWKPSLAAAAAAVIAVQSGLLLQRNEDPMATSRLLSDSPVVASENYWLVQVLFADDSQWQTLVTLIDKADATVVDGPSSLGLVRIAVDKDNALFSNSAELLDWLEQQSQVVHVALEEE